MNTRSKSSQRIASYPKHEDESEVLKPIEYEDCSEAEVSQDEYQRRVLCEMRKSARNSAMKVSKKKSDEIYHRLRAADEKKEENISRLKLEKLIQETNECHFTPEIITKNRKAKHEKVFIERVDQILKEKKERIAQKKIEEVHLREEEMKENCTFQPKINRDSSTSRVKNRVSDISSWKKKFQDKMFEEYFDKQEEASFKPSISKRSQEIARSKTPEHLHKLKVEDRLFQMSKLKKGDPNRASQTSMINGRDAVLSTRTPQRESATRKSVNKPKKDSSRKVITVDQLCASVNQSLSRLSTNNFSSRTPTNGQKSGKEIGQRGVLTRSTQEDLRTESIKTFGAVDAITHSEIDIDILEVHPQPKSDMSEVTQQIYRDDYKLLDSLQTDSLEQYNPDNLTAVFNNILNNPERRKIDQFIPHDKCKTKKDGRKYLKIGDVRIFYDDSCVGDIINFSLRSKLAAGS